jgi:signal transduction histidine kinase
VALTPPGDSQSARWHQVLKSVFDPLSIQPDRNVTKAMLGSDGLSLHVPAIDAVPALRLDYAHGGRSLFSPRDVAVVEEISAMLLHAIESRSAYEKGVSEERTRIARDMHDNIGAQLLGALHSSDAAQKDTMIRETFADIRQILNDTLSPDQSLGELIAELRQETHDRLTLAGLRLDWMSEADPAALPKPDTAHALRSVIREAVSNTIKHAKAARMRVSLSCDGKMMVLIVEDDGVGFDPGAPSSGNGLGRMKGRVEELKGRFRLSRLQRGMRLEAEFPA